ncbi:hypothetical protein D515_04135 [Grimontia indica]|uniref:Uncharacterized protein n=1 Tax=Grimontia indica TaxID=1056512 RepID=R1GYQ1_9GAMM|nr:hypothetical protein D515_04135 [Grimontia indica]
MVCAVCFALMVMPHVRSHKLKGVVLTNSIDYSASTDG